MKAYFSAHSLLKRLRPTEFANDQWKHAEREALSLRRDMVKKIVGQIEITHSLCSRCFDPILEILVFYFKFCEEEEKRNDTSLAARS